MASFSSKAFCRIQIHHRRNRRPYILDHKLRECSSLPVLQRDAECDIDCLFHILCKFPRRKPMAGKPWILAWRWAPSAPTLRGRSTAVPWSKKSVPGFPGRTVPTKRAQDNPLALIHAHGVAHRWQSWGREDLPQQYFGHGHTTVLRFPACDRMKVHPAACACPPKLRKSSLQDRSPESTL